MVLKIAQNKNSGIESFESENEHTNTIKRLSDCCERARQMKQTPNTGARECEGDETTGEPENIDLCQIPRAVPGPENVVRFHQPITLKSLLLLTDSELACAPTSEIDVSFGLTQHFKQSWDYKSTELGNPLSRISLAPLEKRVVEIAYKRKTNVNRSDHVKRSQRSSSNSSSSTKASSNTTSSSASRLNWSVSASASYGIEGVGFGASAMGNIGGETSQNNERSINYITNETSKSSQQVLSEAETTTKIGLETSFEHIEEQTLRNPYADRTLLVTLYELIDRFEVSTSTDELKPCLIVDFDKIRKDTVRVNTPMIFDEKFVNTHSQFIRIALLDDSLAEYLDTFRQLDRIDENNVDAGDVYENAIRCLDFFYAEPFVLPSTSIRFHIDDSYTIEENLSLAETLLAGGTGISDALSNDVTDYYFLMASIRFLWGQDQDSFNDGNLTKVERGRRAIEYVRMLHHGLQSWTGMKADDKRKLHDESHRTEQFRRIPGFIEMAKELVLNQVDKIANAGENSEEDDEQESTEPLTESWNASSSTRSSGSARIVNHLNCFGRYYTEEYLHFLHEWTGITAIEELVSSAGQELRDYLPFLSFEESFIHRTSWIIPLIDLINAPDAVQAFLEDDSFSDIEPYTICFETRHPADGVHMEAVPGTCNLPDLPSISSADWIAPIKVQLSQDQSDDES